MKTFLPLAFLAASLLVAQSSLHAESADDANDEATIERIKAAWDERQREFDTVRATWTSNETYMTGSLFGAASKKNGGDSPAEHVTHSRTYEILLDGNKVRYTRSGPTWDANSGAFKDTTYVCAFDGTQSNSMFSGEANQSGPAGFVRETKGFQDTNEYAIVSVLLAFRPLIESIDGVDLSKWDVTTRKGRVKGRECIVIDTALFESHGKDHARRELWLDPARQYAICRNDLVLKELVRTRIDTQYDSTVRDTFVPSGWNVTVNQSDGKLRKLIRAANVAYDLQPIVTPESFSVAFPVGSVVRDGSRNLRFRQTESGEEVLGRLHPDNAGTDRDAESSSRFTFVVLLNIAIVVIAVAVGCWFIWRRRAKHRP